MELHFIRPYWLLALIPLGYIFLQIRKFNRNNNWRRVCDAHLLPYLVVDESRRSRLLPLLFLALAWLLAVIALSGPSFSMQKQSIYRSGDSRVLVMSLSQSMYMNDGAATRIMRARFKVLDLLESLEEGQTGLVVYAGESHVVVPLTEDNNTIKNLVPILDPNLMPVPGDNLSAGLEEAKKLFQQAKVSRGQIILLADKVSDAREAQQLAQVLKENNMTLSILDFSSNNDDSADLSALAKTAGGISVKVTPNNSDIQELLASMSNTNIQEVHQDKKMQAANLWKDEGIWFAACIIPLALLSFRKGFFL